MQEKDAIVSTSSKRVFRAIRNSEITLLQLMCDFGDPMLYVNTEKRTVLSYAALLGNLEVFELLRDNLPHAEDNSYLYEKDIYGKTGKDYIQINNWTIE